MKKIKPFKNKVPDVRIDPSLDKYKDKVLFPEKLAKANKQLKNVKLPPRAED
jgi:hypothetical protein